MKLTQQGADGVNLIRRYGTDFIVIGEREIRTSCIVSANALNDWTPGSVPELTIASLAPLFALEPEVVVLATGIRQTFPRAALRAEFATRKIGLEVMEIGAACRTYNVLVGEHRKAVAAIMLAGPGKEPE